MVLTRMMFALKKRVAVVLLVLISAWPIAHHVIVGHYGLNPWKWFGWSMYTVPPKYMHVYTNSGATGQRLPFDTLSSEWRQRLLASYKEFGDIHLELGRWVTPDDFARVLFECYPNEERIDIVVKRHGLDHDTAMIEQVAEYSFSYSRGMFE